MGSQTVCHNWSDLVCVHACTHTHIYTRTHIIYIKCLYVCVCAMCCPVWLSAAPWTVAFQALLSMEFFRQEYWSELPFPPWEYLPNPRIKPASPMSSALQAILYPLSHWGSPIKCLYALRNNCLPYQSAASSPDGVFGSCLMCVSSKGPRYPSISQQ